MKNILTVVAATAFLLALSACTSSNAASVDQTAADTSSTAMSMPSDSSSDTAASLPDSGTAMTASSAAATTDTSQAARVIDMTVESWQFTPNTITIHKGENVVLRLKDISGQHSFLSEDLGLNVEIDAGETKDITIPTDKTGTFTFRCGKPCGPGHREMTGTIVIQ